MILRRTFGAFGIDPCHFCSPWLSFGGDSRRCGHIFVARTICTCSTVSSLRPTRSACASGKTRARAPAYEVEVYELLRCFREKYIGCEPVSRFYPLHAIVRVYFSILPPENDYQFIVVLSTFGTWLRAVYC